MGNKLKGLLEMLIKAVIWINNPGVCGGFTTFSTFALESSDLIRDGHMGIALCYVLLSVLVGVLAIFAVEYLTVR